MRKLLLTASALALGLFVAADSMADCNGIYAAVRGGTAKHNYSKDGGSNIRELDSHVFMLSGALGYRYNYYRTELEYVFRDKDDWKIVDGNARSEADIKTRSIMWNHYVDFLPYKWWSPYLNAGIGFTKLKYNDKTIIGEPYPGVDDRTSGYNNNPTRFTWSVGGGLTLKVTNKFNVDVGYRYYDMGKIHKMEVKAHEVYGGLRYVF